MVYTDIIIPEIAEKMKSVRRFYCPRKANAINLNINFNLIGSWP